MHILLTDIVVCPRCGPEFGLILLADRVEERRVLSGVLGCPNCREKYRVQEAWVQFAGAASEAGADGAVDVGSGPVAGDASLRLAAQLGITHGPGFLLVVGPASVHALELAKLIEDIEVVAVEFAGAADPAPAPATSRGVNRLVLSGSSARLPLATGKVQGVALTGAAADTLLEEGVRVLSPVGRLVLDPAPADAVVRLAALKLRPVAEDGTTVVAARY